MESSPAHCIIEHLQFSAYAQAGEIDVLPQRIPYLGIWYGNINGLQKQEMSRMFSYKLQNETWYINCFLMTWIPEADMPILSGADVTVTPAPESVSP